MLSIAERPKGRKRAEKRLHSLAVSRIPVTLENYLINIRGVGFQGEATSVEVWELFGGHQKERRDRSLGWSQGQGKAFFFLKAVRET